MARGPTDEIIAALIARAAFSAAILGSRAEGALAVGLPPDVVKGSYASGYSYSVS